MHKKKATKTELAIGVIVGFILAMAVSGYMLDWYGRLTYTPSF